METTNNSQLDDIFENQNYVAYDINLKADDLNVQPVGDVVVQVKLPEKLLGKEVEVFYVDDEGNKQLIPNSSVEKDKVSFVTNHFSTYAVVAKENDVEIDKDIPWTDIEPSTPVEKEETVDWSEIKPADKVEKEETETPETSDHHLVFVYGLVALLSAAIAVVLKKKKNYSNHNFR